MGGLGTTLVEVIAGLLGLIPRFRPRPVRKNPLRPTKK